MSSGTSQQLPLETVEFALERVFSSKKYGRDVPETLLLNIRELANDGTSCCNFARKVRYYMIR